MKKKNNWKRRKVANEDDPLATYWSLAGFKPA